MNIRVFLLFFLVFGLNLKPLFACKCSLINIADNYQRAGLIFYGKYLETITLPNVYDEAGKNLVVENFQVIRFYKGVADGVLKQDSAFKISLRSTCNKSSCGYCFDAGKTYLVYATMHEGVLGVETDLCSRTKEITQNNFIISGGVDPDAGKDETKELMRLSAKDTSIQVSGEKWLENKLADEEIKKRLQKELKKKNSMSITLATTTLILFFYVILGWFKPKKTKA
jgi:hypothetical protein